MYEVRVKSRFSAAHALRGYGGNCERLHGHNWTVEVCVAAERLDECGLAVDFRTVKALLGEVVSELDHRFLNDLEPFSRANPSTEGIAQHIFEALASRLPPGVTLVEVTAGETPDCLATYRP